MNERAGGAPWLGSLPRSRRLVGTLIVALLLVLSVALPVHRATIRAAMVRADPDAILASPALRGAALRLGRDVFAARCAICHGSAGKGHAGVPDLTDRDWLYGEGRASEIEAIVRYGIRSGHPKGWNLASMPGYASARPYAAEPLPPLAPGQVDDVVQMLLVDEGGRADTGAIVRGRAVFVKAGCWDCHGPEGRGDAAIGAPDLRDAVTLFGGSSAALRRSVERGRRGTSPAFADRLGAAEVRAVAVYVASLSDSDAGLRRKGSR